MILSFNVKNYLCVLKKLWKNQNSLPQELKRGTELEEQALSGLCDKIMHTKYSINKKAAWCLVRNSDPVETEQIINYIFMSY